MDTYNENTNEPTYDIPRNKGTDPFSNEGELDFYYSFEALEQRLSTLKQLLKGSDFLILVIGEQGSGKTTMMNRFMKESEEEWAACRIRAKSRVDSGESAQLQNLDGHLAYILNNEEHPVVMLDNAHELSSTELSVMLKITNRNGATSKLKRLILFCEPQIKSMMSALSDVISPDAVITKLYMATLDKKQTEEYILARLKMSGFTGKNPYKTSEIKAIYKQSGGIPGLVNEEARNILTSKLSKKSPKNVLFRKNTSTGLKKYAVQIIGAAIIFTAAVFLYQDEIGNIFGSKPSPVIMEQNENNAEAKWAGEGSKEKNAAKKADKTESFDEEDLKSGKKDTKQFNRSYDEKVTDMSESAMKTSEMKNRDAKNDEPTEVKPKKKSDSTVESNIKTSEIKPEPVKTATLPKVKQEKAKEPEADKEMPPKSMEAVIKTATDIRKEKWILDQPANHYTIQLMGVSNEEALVRFIKDNHLENNAAYYKSMHNGNDWFPMIYGVYASVAEANAAIRDILAQDVFQKAGVKKPWIRKLSTIQSQINK